MLNHYEDIITIDELCEILMIGNPPAVLPIALFYHSCYFLLLSTKKTHGLHLLFHTPLPTHPQVRVTLIYNCFFTYANCITSFSISSTSSDVNSGKKVGISSTDIRPFFNIVIAFLLVVSLAISFS